MFSCDLFFDICKGLLDQWIYNHIDLFVMMNAWVGSGYHKINKLSKNLTDLVIFFIDLFSSIIKNLSNHLIYLSINMHFMINIWVCTRNSEIHQIPESLIHLFVLGGYLITMRLSIWYNFVDFSSYFIGIFDLFFRDDPINKVVNL